jgi:hypothetical protein
MVCPSVSSLLYVDDVAISYNSWSIVAVEHWLQLTMNHLSHWVLQNKFSFFAAKTQCVCFTRLQGLHPFLSLFSTAVLFCFLWLSSCLGLHLESWLLWEPHLWRLCIYCDQSLNILSILSGRSWGQDWMVMVWLHLLTKYNPWITKVKWQNTSKMKTTEHFKSNGQWSTVRWGKVVPVLN